MKLLAVGYNDGALWAYDELASWLLDHDVDFHRIRPASDKEVIEQGQTADIILAYKYPISRKLMQALPKLSVLMSSGSGYDHLDVDAATDLGIVVTNAAMHNVDDVAELTLALILLCGRKLQKVVDAVKGGDWRPGFQPINRVQGKTLGLIGFGNIAKAVAWRANGIGLSVVCHSRSASSEVLQAYDVTSLTLPELLQQSDFISLHLASTAQTRHTLQREHFQQMKSSAFVINTSRGDLIHEDDLIAALQEGQIAGAGLDVLAEEPPPQDHPLLVMDNVVVTGHSAASTVEAAQDWVAEWKNTLSSILKGTMPTTCVNPDVKPKIRLKGSAS